MFTSRHQKTRHGSDCRTARPLAVLLPAALFLSTALRSETLVIGTFDASRSGPDSNVVDGAAAGDARDALGANIEALGFDGFRIDGTDDLTADGFLDGIDILLIHNAYANGAIIGGFPPEEQDALLDFVTRGGSAFVLADGWRGSLNAANEFIAPFGMVIGGPTKGTDVGSVGDPEIHPVTDGPFGRVETFTTHGGGWFDDLGPFAIPLATLSATGLPCLAVIDEGEIEAGSGRVVLTTDVTAFADSDLGPFAFFRVNDKLFLNSIAWLAPRREALQRFLRGDCNDDGNVDLSDATCALDWLFAGGPEPGCRAALNTNSDGQIDIADPVALLNFLFGGGPMITAPFPDCGPGRLPADAKLGCANPPDCQ